MKSKTITLEVFVHTDNQLDLDSITITKIEGVRFTKDYFDILKADLEEVEKEKLTNEHWHKVVMEEKIVDAYGNGVNQVFLFPVSVKKLSNE